MTLAFAPEKFDILVRYAEQCEDSKVFRTNSYWLLETADNPPKSGHQEFIEAAPLPALKPIPIANWSKLPAQTGYSACLLIGEQAFDLFHEGVIIGEFRLPYYSVHGRPTVSRVMLTPPAVMADTLIVSSVVGVYVAPWALQFYANKH